LDERAIVATLPGIREAVLLTAILQEVMGLPASDVASAVKRLPKLPDLPILDHPRPPQRAATLHEGDTGEGRRPRSRRRRRHASHDDRSPTQRY